MQCSSLKYFHHLQNLTFPAEELEKKIDLEIIMNPTPYAVKPNMSLARTYKLFRNLGLRHVIVVDNEFKVQPTLTLVNLIQFLINMLILNLNFPMDVDIQRD
ncbi:H(+)/Cl(-) exchange transporter 7-like isoform X1 [Nilaparvata lugens]|uniref:H(+)/Cl(-) exchange transporter 7-like isoform X1 n=1 Tax=Nilaparvata lugens TaxID=108931 RepID=UPI00193D3F76|nr:H(+)/Cl(-) exchange transporter 7-like isoform X1 [Nilaparvata lugens]